MYFFVIRGRTIIAPFAKPDIWPLERKLKSQFKRTSNSTPETALWSLFRISEKGWRKFSLGRQGRGKFLTSSVISVQIAECRSGNSDGSFQKNLQTRQTCTHNVIIKHNLICLVKNSRKDIILRPAEEHSSNAFLPKKKILHRVALYSRERQKKR